MSDPKLEIMTDPRLSRLGNALSDAIHGALAGGLQVDEACSVAIGVVADYWVQAYPLDDEAVEGLSRILRNRARRGLQ